MCGQTTAPGHSALPSAPPASLGQADADTSHGAADACARADTQRDMQAPLLARAPADTRHQDLGPPCPPPPFRLLWGTRCCLCQTPHRQRADTQYRGVRATQRTGAHGAPSHRRYRTSTLPLPCALASAAARTQSGRSRAPVAAPLLRHGKRASPTDCTNST
ncbi:hypothetical protein B0H16DRAFT_1736984 [Mycena metata]|uniref:Uncharacterized protein n=1 Tax=Mycena metata TaxID=1033252 RepID=A0AAD7MMH6_9AGAR|nr:hypothetical protein B0H16DRAFT_1736984 [Mycena metata]